MYQVILRFRGVGAQGHMSKMQTVCMGPYGEKDKLQGDHKQCW